MQWFGKPVAFSRFLGQVDQDDPTNLPVGLAAVCRNTDFTRDAPGVTCANTRAGINSAMQLIGLDGKSAINPVTGAVFFAYSPELITEKRFEMPVAYEAGGCLQRESPVGSGHMKAIPNGPLFTPPAGAVPNFTAAENLLWAAWSDLKAPVAGMSCINPKVLQGYAATGAAVNPFGMKPVGWYWQPNTAILAGEICCPPTPVNGNGHTYQAQNAGVTGANPPAFPLTEDATVIDNPGASQVVWKEWTMVLANRLPAPGIPAIAVVAGGSTFPGGQDIYLRTTLANAQGESLAGLPAVAADPAASSTINVTLPTLASLPGWIATLGPQFIPTSANVYVAAVPTGNPAPPLSAYREFGSGGALGTVVAVTGAGTGAPPPNFCTARVTPGQLPTPDVEVIIERAPGAGAFAAGRDVYVLQTYTNSVGETKAGPTNVIVNTVLNDGVQVTVAVPEDDNGNPLYSIDQVGIYEADVETGTPAPPTAAFCLVGYYAAGATPIITDTATGQNPPTVNGTGPGGAIAADTATGGPNATQGMRYAALLFVNQNETVSGFTIASVVGYAVDEDGWELGVFKIATGPANIVARPVAFTVADASMAGPFCWSGIVDLLVPSQNVVYPQTTLVDGVQQSATVLLDNVTQQMTVNFTDSFIQSANNVDDRTDILPPFPAVRIDYLKTINALAFTGVPGYAGGGLISISGDPESVYADTGALPFPSDGQRCYGFTDAYKSVILALREEGGYVVQPNSGNPASWDVVQRWSDVGPCGFRAWAANGKFVIFVHRSGAYKYDESDPDLMSKEVPRAWSRINWQYGHLIDVTIDEDTHTVRIQVPTGQSTVNNEEFCLSYLEGWQNPIHFSTYNGKEISMDAARRWSFNDVAASMCIRMNRTLPKGAAFMDGPDWTDQMDASYGISQLLYCSSGFDGTVQARTPGIYADNGAGIDWVWESMCAGLMQAVCKPEGFNLNALGNGIIFPSLLAARDQDDGDGGPGENEVELDPFELQQSQQIGITRKVEPMINEFWRVRFTNGKTPGHWCSLKQMTFYLIPFTVGRGSWEGNRGQ